VRELKLCAVMVTGAETLRVSSTCH